MKKLANALTVALAVLAAVIAVRLAMRLDVWVWVTCYWIVNAVRNTIDAKGRMSDGRH